MSIGALNIAGDRALAIAQADAVRVLIETCRPSGFNLCWKTMAGMWTMN